MFTIPIVMLSGYTNATEKSQTSHSQLFLSKKCLSVSKLFLPDS